MAAEPLNGKHAAGNAAQHANSYEVTMPDKTLTRPIDLPEPPAEGDWDIETEQTVGGNVG